MFDNDMGEGVDGDCFVQCLQDWLYDHHYNEETDTYELALEDALKYALENLV